MVRTIVVLLLCVICQRASSWVTYQRGSGGFYPVELPVMMGVFVRC